MKLLTIIFLAVGMVLNSASVWAQQEEETAPQTKTIAPEAAMNYFIGSWHCEGRTGDFTYSYHGQ